MKLAISQLVAVASGAGFQGDDLVTAVAVALAESGGNPQAYNPEKAAGAAQGRGSYGLWQIYITAHPEYSAAQLLDPTYNAQAAYAVYSEAGGTFRPWSTFKNGAYLAHTDSVLQAIPAPSPDVVASDAGSASDTVATSDGTVADPTTGGDGGGSVAGLVIFGALAFLLARNWFNG